MIRDLIKEALTLACVGAFVFTLMQWWLLIDSLLHP